MILLMNSVSLLVNFWLRIDLAHNVSNLHIFPDNLIVWVLGYIIISIVFNLPLAPGTFSQTKKWAEKLTFGEILDSPR